MRRSTRHAALAFALAAVATACIRDPDPFTVDADDVSVHLILEAGADSAAAIVERPGDVVEDAVVLLIQGADTTQLPFVTGCREIVASPPEEACHRAQLAAPIEPGAMYELEITLPGGHRITGQTTVPVLLQPTSPAPGSVVTVDCNDPLHCFAEGLEVPPYFIPVLETVVRWEQSADPERLFGFIRPLRTWLDGVAYENRPGSDQRCELGFFDVVFAFANDTEARIAPDSMELMVPNIQCFGALLQPARFDSIHAEAVVQHQNLEYAAYLEAMRDFGGSSRASHLSLGLAGAWGVFGAFTPTIVPLTLVRDPEPGPPVSCPPDC